MKYVHVTLLVALATNIIEGWKTVNPGSTALPWPSSPLQILTNTTSGEVHLTVTTVAEQTLSLSFSLAKSHLDLPECGGGPEIPSLDPASDGTAVWTISKDGVSNTLLLLKNGQKEVEVDVSACPWNETLRSVRFNETDTASVQYRVRPTSCTTLPPLLTPDRSLPVADGSPLVLSCPESGYFNVGDGSVTCDTDLYGDLRYSGSAPWCVGVSGRGDEALLSGGTPPTLSCSFSHFPPFTLPPTEIVWLKGDKILPKTSTTSVTSTSINSNLTLASLPPVGLHSYTCRPSSLPSWTSNVSLNVFSVVPVSKDTVAGRPATLSCSTNNTPTASTAVSWWREGGERVRRGVKTVNAGPRSLLSTLSLPSSTTDQNYTCRVQTARRTYNFPVQLNCYEVEGSLLDLCAAECRVRGAQGRMDIRWSLNGETLMETVESEWSAGRDQRSVALKLRGPGTYTCTIRSPRRPLSPVHTVSVDVPGAEESKTSATEPILWAMVGVVVVLGGVVAAMATLLLRQKKRVHRLSMRVTSRKILDSVGDIPSVYRRRCSSTINFAREDSVEQSKKRVSGVVAPPALSELDQSTVVERPSREESGDDEGGVELEWGVSD